MSTIRKLNPRNIIPEGWLADQLEIQKNGLSGNLDKIWRDVRDSAWIGGTAESWERMPYFLDGFIPLGFLTGDEDIKARAKKYVYAIVDKQQPDGWICPCPTESSRTYDVWALFLIGKVLSVWLEYNDDKKVYAALYKAMKCLYEKMKKGEEIQGRKKIALKNLFFRNGLRFIRGREYVDGSGLLQLTVLVCPILGTKKSVLVKECLEKYYEKAFYKGMEGSWLHPGENRLSFIEENGFHILFGQRCCNKKGENVCGDTFSFTNFGRKRAVMLLSDGMGTGKLAKESSMQVLRMLENLLLSGFDKEISIDLINTALMNQSKEIFATMDIAIVDLYEGNIEFIKSGACPTYIKNKKNVQIIKAESLPTGIVGEHNIQTLDKDIASGDIMVMCSDGILDANIEYKNKELWVKYVLEDIETTNTKKVSSLLINEAIDNNFGVVKDDMSVIVCKFIKK